MSRHGYTRHGPTGRLGLLVLCSAVACVARAAYPVQPCRIEVREAGSGWPVPLVELRTNHQVCWVTDNAGVVAMDAPELMGREVWFTVRGHGYDVPPDGFGFRGVRLTPEPGQTLRVEVQRKIVARRIGRITGGGLLSESQRLDPQWQAEPESGILGCDSVQNAVHDGRLYWFWGDTVLARYPLGIFHGTGAVTPLHPLATPMPPLQLRLEYFRGQDGQPREIAPMPGSGPTWITGVVSLPDRQGRAHLVCSYVKVKPPLEAYQWGLAQWNPQLQAFEPLRIIWTKSAASTQPPTLPKGHVTLWQDTDGQQWAIFGDPLPTLKCPALYEAWQDPNTWQAVSCQQALIDHDSGNDVKPHSGSIAWNSYRARWVTVFMQAFGQPSAFGELWYAEAASPFGPWGRAVKVLSHDNYTFYNPRLHPEFTADNPRLLLFEGTYTVQFADRPEPTPRWDYNQVLYRLDLDDPALAGARQPDTGP